jgi:hypothetical protein
MNVSAPASGAGVLFSEDCKVAYVLPPVKGRASVSALVPNLNLQFCPGVSSVGELTETLVSSIAATAKQMKALLDQYAPLEAEVQALGERISVSRAERAAALKAQELINERRERALSELETQMAALKSCKLLAPDPCLELQAAVNQSRTQVRELELETTKADRALVQATRKAQKDEQSLLALQERYVRAMEPALKLQERLATLHDKVLELYRVYAPLEGATGQIEYSIDWDKLVESYRLANPSLHVRWERIPVKEAELWASVKLRGEHAEIPAILRSSIPGMRVTGIKGIAEADAPTKAEQTQLSTPASVDFSNSVSGQIVLSLVGACPYFESAYATRTGINLQELAAYLVANVTYQYEAFARRGYEAKYNLNNFYKRVETKRKKGGFFSSKVIHSIVEEGDSKDWFEIKFDAPTTGEFQYSAEEQAAISREVKADLIDRAMRQFAFLAGGAATPPGVPVVMPTGASSASRALGKCPYFYCQAASLGLGVLDSIFGRSTAVSSFERHNDVWTKDVVRGAKVVTRATTSTFSPEQN